MAWLWPGFLFLLGIIPLLIAGYVWMLRRRKRVAVRFSSLSLLRDALPKSSRWRRHAPFALFVLALTALLLALARPVAVVSVPAGKTTVILAIDVSRSMRATDIAPSRLEAAEAAALSFVQSQTTTTQIGIVAFAGFAEMIQPPTTDQESLELAITSLTTGRGTAVGSGLLEAIDVISQIDPSVPPTVRDDSVGPPPAPVPKGAYAPAIVVVLTDGVSTTGPPPLDAAQQALDRGLRVYTIGFGTENGGIPFGGPSRDLQGGGGSGGGGGNFGGFRRGIDEDTLREIADMTGGEYYSAESANELQTVLQDLPTSLIMRTELTELSVFFTAAGALLAALAIGLALLWHPLP